MIPYGKCTVGLTAGGLARALRILMAVQAQCDGRGSCSVNAEANEVCQMVVCIETK